MYRFKAPFAESLASGSLEPHKTEPIIRPKILNASRDLANTAYYSLPGSITRNFAVDVFNKVICRQKPARRKGMRRPGSCVDSRS
jgi:hypothetical protein